MRPNLLLFFCLLLLLGISSTAEAARIDFQAIEDQTIRSNTSWVMNSDASVTTSYFRSSPYSLAAQPNGIIYTDIFTGDASAINYTFYSYSNARVLVTIIEYDADNTLIRSSDNVLYHTAYNTWSQLGGNLALSENTSRIRYQMSYYSTATAIIDDITLNVFNDTIQSSEKLDYGQVTANIIFPRTYASKITYYYDTTAWQNYTTHQATATIDGISASVTDYETYLTINTPVHNGDNIIIAKEYENEITVSPADGATIPPEDPYNTIVLSWDNVGENTFIFSPDENFGYEWYNHTSNDTTTTISLNPGEYHWKVINWDNTLNCWQKTESVFTISNAVSTPGRISIEAYDELNKTKINSFTATISNSTSQLNKTTTTGLIEFTSAEVASGEYQVTVSSGSHLPRTVTAISPCNISVYSLPNTGDESLISFSIIDYTNQFLYTETRLKITEPNNNGGIVISDSYFSAAGVNKVYLQNNKAYSLELISDDYTKSTGTYTPTQSESVSLVVGDIALIPASENYAGFNYTISKTEQNVTFTWRAPANSLTEQFSYTVTDENGTIVYSISSLAPAGMGKYTYADPTAQYKISLTANTTQGILTHTEYVSGDPKIVDLQISEKWYNLISVFLIGIIGLCFSYRSASLGAMIAALTTALLYGIGMLHISILIVSLVVTIGLLAIMRGR